VGRRSVQRSAFLAVWAAQSVSSVGSQFSLIALPLLAVSALHAGPFEVGLLATAETLPYLIVSLPAGVLADRSDRRTLMIVSDVGRAIALGVLPPAFFLGVGSLPLLIASALVVGSLSVVFTVAQQSYLPEIVDDEDLTGANQRVEVSDSGARVVGPTLGGAAVHALGVFAAVLGDAASYLGSAIIVLLAPRPERRVVSPPERGIGLRGEMLEGLQAVWWDRVLRDLMLATALFNLASGMVLAQVVLFSTHDLGMDAGFFGLAYGVANGGFVLGALSVTWLERRIGAGTMLIACSAIGALAVLLIGGAGLGLGVAGLVLGRFAGAVSSPIINVAIVTVRQRRTAGRLHGRVAATFRCIDWGTAPIGAILSGVIGSAHGLTSVMLLAAGFAIASAALLTVGPVRSVTLHPTERQAVSSPPLRALPVAEEI